MKSIVCIADLHCGSIYGITPPEYQKKESSRSKLQKESWEAYLEITQQWRNPDILLVNGDAIEGTQPIQGGLELLSPDRNIQCLMAIDALKRWNAKTILMTYGSPYHVGQQEDWEYQIADKLDAKIEGNLFFTVEGMTFNARHAISGSNVFSNRASSLLSEMSWAMIKEAEETGPHVDVLIRSHIHYMIWVETFKRTMFSTPCLQLSRGRYGSRKCPGGDTHWGAIRLIVDKGQIIRKDIICKNLVENRPKVMRIK